MDVQGESHPGYLGRRLRQVGDTGAEEAICYLLLIFR
jgi:hypothetical protein